MLANVFTKHVDNLQFEALATVSGDECCSALK